MRRSLIAATYVGFLVLTAAGPAGAGGITTCPEVAGEGDARIRKPGKPYTGDSIYVVSDQYKTAHIDVGETAKFDVRVRNDTGSTRKLVVEGGATGTYLEMRYLRDGQDITDKVTGGGKGFADVAPGDSTPAVRVKVTLLQEPLGTGVFTFVTGRTGNAPTTDEDECTGDSVLPRIPDPTPP